jgi:diacylglycerol kinase (ATP)
MSESKNGKAVTFSLRNEAISSPHDSSLINDIPYNRQFSWQIASSLIVSFKYAWAGITYSFRSQRNFRVHVAIATIAISLGVWLQVSSTQLAIISLTCAMVMVLELLNTAIESVVDLAVKQTYHELAKIAKDCAAGAVLVSALAAVTVAGFILLPPLLELIRTGLN